MKLQFDASQQYQLDAINSIVDIFKGQPLSKGVFELEVKRPDDELQLGGEFVVGNKLMLEPDTIIANLHEIQTRNELTISEVATGATFPASFPLDFSRRLQYGMNFSIEMETGTGKTYVYLRTIHELYQKYGFKKFVIVVPSIAIREGVLKNLEITAEHFAMLYENPALNFEVYDPKKRNLLKTFATNNTLQILVINIDSFAKYSDEKAGKNIIYQNSDWGIPIEYLKAVSPIVIVDEPQNMETDIRKKAIENLNPLCTLRYSATHKNLYNVVYTLDPVKAYDLGLVKKIEVDSVITEDNHNAALIEVVSFQTTSKSVSAKLKIEVVDSESVGKKAVTVRLGDDLYRLSNQREVYKDGFIVNDIGFQAKSITFSNGLVLYEGQSQGGMTDAIMKYQIRKTIENHVEKEAKLRGKGIKVLSLFFIDRVANYREYTEGKPNKGKFALWFEELYKEIARNPKYQELMVHSADSVHNGYFSQDKQGGWKDTKGTTQADDDTYAIIMKEKEKLLSMEEPLKFIFSHSALKEGWDNPNVFQICTLREITSEGEKRQTIGRGLRLSVNQDGKRVFDENINILTVIANDSYEDFAKSLQTEIERECGVSFSGRVRDKRKRKQMQLRKGYQLDENFISLWDRIKVKTRFQVSYDSNELIRLVANELKTAAITAPKIKNIKVKVDLTRHGIDTGVVTVNERTEKFKGSVPDVLGDIQNKTRLTKDTILKIIKASGRLADIFINPQQFMDITSHIINSTLTKMMVDGVKYEKIASEVWEMQLFENQELESYLENLVEVKKVEKTLYNYVPVDHQVESEFAKDLDSREDVKFYFKLPSWFTIQTPLGTYNPDWAIVFEKDKRVYFVAETKSKGQELRPSEQMKIDCGRKHFEEFEDVTYMAPITKVSDIVI